MSMCTKEHVVNRKPERCWDKACPFQISPFSQELANSTRSISTSLLGAVSPELSTLHWTLPLKYSITSTLPMGDQASNALKTHSKHRSQLLLFHGSAITRNLNSKRSYIMLTLMVALYLLDVKQLEIIVNASRIFRMQVSETWTHP